MNIRSLLYLCTLSLLFVLSCKKRNSGNNGASPSSYFLSAVVYSSTQFRAVDSYYYDRLHRLDTVASFIYDTTGGAPQFNTSLAQFVYQDSNTYPSYYNLYDPLLGNYGDYHLLSYDPDNRIIKDTSLSGSGYVVYFTYPGNNITYNIEFEGTPQNNLIDTFRLTAGNVTTETSYAPYILGQPDVLQYNFQYGYTAITNPGYHEVMTNSIGPLLTTLELNYGFSFIDFISKNVSDRDSGIESMPPTFVSFDLILTTDNKGRLSQTASSYGANVGLTRYFYY